MVSPLCFSNLFGGLVKDNIFEMLQMLHQNKLDIARLNYGVLVLIPKIKGANKIKQFRPICLLNVIYKIITKVLTLRLNNVASKVISEAQTAFILRRFILDAALIVREVLHELRVKKEQGIVLKLDFEKAYDKVNWSFLRDVLLRKNFSEKWIDLVISAVQGGKVAVNLNGEVGSYSRSYKGLRQGDPLSSLLFNLVDDALLEMLEKAQSRGVIHGVVPG